MSAINIKTQVDSPEGIDCLMQWARASGAYLSPYHERIAKKHSVSTDGVNITRPIPVMDFSGVSKRVWG